MDGTGKSGDYRTPFFNQALDRLQQNPSKARQILLTAGCCQNIRMVCVANEECQ
jgi:hypothetical protein